MKLIHRAAVVCTCLALAASAFGTPVKAQEENVNLAEKARVIQYTPGNLESDTLSAVNDGVRYPWKAHNDAGANPFAWTNYDSAQTVGIDSPSILSFYLGHERYSIGTVVIYYFVDSWSASLPKKVELGSDGVFLQGPYSNELILLEEEQVSDTCVKCTYEAVAYSHASNYYLRFWADDSSLKQGNTRCVGVYEVELYERPDYEVKYNEFTIDSFAGMTAGSVETAHGKWVDYARDGNPNTLWHSDWAGCDPEDMWIEMYQGKSVPMLTGLRYLPRSGNRSGDNNGRIAAYEVQAAVWGINEYSEYEISWRTIASGRWEDTEGWKEVRFDTPVYDNDTLHIRLVAKETYGVQRNKWVSAAEIELIGASYNK